MSHGFEFYDLEVPVTRLRALVGVTAISFSAVFVRLAAVSPVTATFYRALYAVPALAVIHAAGGSSSPRDRRARRLAFASGILLALDLVLWHESIALIGAGIATVIANVQVVFVAFAAWWLFGERLSTRTCAIIAAVLFGIALTSGLARPDAYGANPVVGVLLGLAAGASYACFLLTFRTATRPGAPVAGPLLDSTIGVVAGALVAAPFDPHFAFTPSWPAHGWLAALALVAQVVGWLLIATALPQLPAVETSILLLVQPVLTVLWGRVFFDERLSVIQWAGIGLVLAGVGSMSRRR